MEAPEPISATPEALASVSLSIAGGLLLLLIRKGLLSKQEVLDLYRGLADAKYARGSVYRSVVEAEAGALLDYLHLEERLSD